MRKAVLAMMTGCLVLGGAPVAAQAAPEPVELIVGLRPGRQLTADVREVERLTGAVAVEVAPGDVAGLRADPAVAFVEPDHVARIDAITPDDPGFAGQWGIARARVDEAWTATRGSGAVVVAVVDTGVAALPDLAPRLLPGHDFVNDDDDATDDNGHGTMSAGVIAAGADNGTGIAGLCWTCRILPVKVLGDDGSGSYSDIAEGIRYAADHDADIINLSLGGAADSQLLRDAVAYATGRGALVLAAAGNEGSPLPHYPAAIPAAVAVGASTAGDARYPWSNHGSSWVDVAAPGCNPAQGPDGVLGQFCGTSSATPFAAGVAALMASTSPQPSAATIRRALQTSAAPLAGDWVAAGRVDAAAALDALPFWVSGVVSHAYVGASVTMTPHVGAGSGITRVTARLNGVPAATATAAPWTLTVDTRGVTGAATLTVTATAGTEEKGTATVRVTADHARPTVSFVAPPYVRGTALIGARAADDVAVARVELLAGGRPVATDTTGPYRFRLPTGTGNGPVTLTLRAYDRAGNVRTATRTVIKDNRAPVVRVVSGPRSGTRGLDGTAHLAVRATDASGIARQALLVDGRVAARSTRAEERFAVRTWRYGRRLTVRVCTWDTAGNSACTPVRTWSR